MSIETALNALNPHGPITVLPGIKPKAARWLRQHCSPVELQALAPLTAEKIIEQVRSWCNDPELYLEFEKLQFTDKQLAERRKAERERNTPKLFLRRRGEGLQPTPEQIISGKPLWKRLDRVAADAAAAAERARIEFEYPEIIEAPEIELP